MTLVPSKFSSSSIDITYKFGNVTVKLIIIHEYNQKMNGCDCLDQLFSYYSNFQRKTLFIGEKEFFPELRKLAKWQFIEHILTRPEGSKKIIEIFQLKSLGDLFDRAFNLEAAADEKKNERALVNKKHLVAYVPSDINNVCSAPGSRKHTYFIYAGCEAFPHFHPKDSFLYCKY